MVGKKTYRIFLLVLWLLCHKGSSLHAQQIDLQSFGTDIKQKITQKPRLLISGGFSANTIIYNGNVGSGRDPFAFNLNGNMSVSLYDITIPISLNYSNVGFSYSYDYPRPPTRLSLHPKYKWITGHIGDVSMSFSPYTYSGYLFSGLGVDLAPKGNFKYAGFYGRLQKAVEYVPRNGNNLAAYERFGYGTKISFDKQPYKAAFIFFHAKDELNSLAAKPDSIPIYPQQNTALSFEGAVPVLKNLVAKIEYAVSVLTKDVRAPKFNDSVETPLLVKLFGNQMSTHVYHAMKANLDYTIGSSQIGVGIEQVDPGYQTLGAYYFNNDLQNITANFAQSLFKGKVNLSGNVGLQRDNLDNKKANAMNRTVFAINATWAASAKLNMSTQYSNFTTFTNVRPQFQLINQLTPFDNLDTLNFQQLSQTANANINYVMADDKERPKNLNLNLSFQDSYDDQGGVVAKGNASQFYNFAGSYSVSNIKKNLSVAYSMNATYNTVGKNDVVTWGGTINYNKGFFKNTFKTNASLTYNRSSGAGNVATEVGIARITCTYVLLKKHNLSLNSTWMLRSPQKPELPVGSDHTTTVTYQVGF
jgi:hypothetical protein